VDHFTKLGEALKTYMDSTQIETIHQAFLMGEKAHQGQSRRTGEPYITHPVAVAEILAGMRMDPESIAAALLHDVIEDTGVDKQTISHKFGKQVAELVDGVSKLTQIQFESRAEAQAENLRKMILAMAKDLRVIIVKLADRLHNMRTLSALPPSKRKRIALETLEIYAPIANRLGMHNFRVEFEELGFAALYPLRSRILVASVRKARGNRKEIMSVIRKALRSCLGQPGMPNCKISGREKHIYSIYKKMRNKTIPFSEIMDVYAFRIVVDSTDSCYRVLGAVHNLYKPMMERFKDYIAIPKANGYQSLHTTLFGPYGVPIEIQIRTEEMEAMANKGIASHWVYKTDENSSNMSHIRAQEWLKGLVEMQQSAGSSLEFMENVKIDLFPDEVYVFTPKGNILELPSGSSVVDFAYTIHTDVGNQCVAAKINRRLVPLSSQLINGQTVEIITSVGAQPNPAWLNFVVTGKARSAIKHYLKKQRSSESIILGKRLLERALGTLSLSLADLVPDNVKAVLKESNCKTFDDLFEAMGLGSLSPLMVARRLAFAVREVEEEEEQEKREATATLSKKPLLIKGTEGMVVGFANCCRPIPGDVVIGIFDAGRGIKVHMEQCKEVDMLRHTDKCIYLSWEENVCGEFEVDLDVTALNEKGLLANLAMAVASAQANIESINVARHENQDSLISLTISVKNRDHLAKVMRRLRTLRGVDKIVRKK